MKNSDSNENSEVKLLSHREAQPTEADFISLNNKNGIDLGNELDLQSDKK